MPQLGMVNLYPQGYGLNIGPGIQSASNSLEKAFELLAERKRGAKLANLLDQMQGNGGQQPMAPQGMPGQQPNDGPQGQPGQQPMVPQGPPNLSSIAQQYGATPADIKSIANIQAQQANARARTDKAQEQRYVRIQNQNKDFNERLTNLTPLAEDYSEAIENARKATIAAQDQVGPIKGLIPAFSTERQKLDAALNAVVEKGFSFARGYGKQGQASKAIVEKIEQAKASKYMNANVILDILNEANNSPNRLLRSTQYRDVIRRQYNNNPVEGLESKVKAAENGLKQINNWEKNKREEGESPNPGFIAEFNGYKYQLDENGNWNFIGLGNGQ